MKQKQSFLSLFLLWPVLFLFSGCALKYSPPPDFEPIQITKPTIEAEKAIVADGKSLFAINKINDSTQPIIIGIHGFRGQAQDFCYFSNYCQQHHLSFFAFDLRGCGHWPEMRGDLPSLRVWLHDIRDIIKAIKNKYPQRIIILMGESLGAALTYWYCSEYKNQSQIQPDGIIAISLVTRPYQKRIFSVMDLTLGCLFNPIKPMPVENRKWVKDDGDECSRKIKKNQLNEVSFRFLFQAGYVINLAKKPEYISQIRIPSLFIVGKKDHLSRQKDIKKIQASMENLQTFYALETGSHSLLTDATIRDELFARIESWILDLY